MCSSDLGKEEIDLFYFGPSHTSGDAFVVFKEARTMHAGDAFAGKNTPIIDTMNGGSSIGYGKTLSKAYLEAQEKVLREDLPVFEAYAKSGDNERLKVFAEEMVPVLRGHLEQLAKVRK